MKFLRVAGVHYPKAKRIMSQFHQLSYEDHLRAIFSLHIHYADSLTHQLQKFGYSTAEILCDLEVLQKKWADEHGYRYTDQWQTEILIRQIQHFKPEILYLHNIYSLPISIIRRRNELFPFLRTLIMFRGYPEINKPLFEILSLADLLLVGSPILEKICKNQNLKPHLFHQYFDDRILKILKLGQKIYPFTFLGTSGFGYGWNHQPRYNHLMELLQNTSIECWLEEEATTAPVWKEFIKKKAEAVFSWLPKKTLHSLNENISIHSTIRKFAFNGLSRKISAQNGTLTFPNVPLTALFPKQCHTPVFGIEMSQILASSSLTFNRHTFAAQGTVDNIRLFEATGVGTCLLTDSGSNLSLLFKPDKEVVTYSSSGECLEKINFLLKNEGTMQEIAKNGQTRTLCDHTASSRALQLKILLDQAL